MSRELTSSSPEKEAREWLTTIRDDATSILEACMAMPPEIVVDGEGLALIREIATTGASALDPKIVEYALQELSQVFLEVTGEDRTDDPFAPIDISVILKRKTKLRALKDLLQNACRGHRYN